MIAISAIMSDCVEVGDTDSTRHWPMFVLIRIIIIIDCLVCLL